MLNVDFAPTFVDLAGLKPPAMMDGESIKPVLHAGTRWGPEWRTDFIVEHWGEYQNINPGCPQWNGMSMTVSLQYRQAKLLHIHVKN